MLSGFCCGLVRKQVGSFEQSGSAGAVEPCPPFSHWKVRAEGDLSGAGGSFSKTVEPLLLVYGDGYEEDEANVGAGGRSVQLSNGWG